MNLLAFHNHLGANGINFLNLDEDFIHAIYHDPEADKFYSINRTADTIKSEVVHIACRYFDIPLPNQA